MNCNVRKSPGYAKLVAYGGQVWLLIEISVRNIWDYARKHFMAPEKTLGIGRKLSTNKRPNCKGYTKLTRYVVLCTVTIIPSTSRPELQRGSR